MYGRHWVCWWPHPHTCLGSNIWKLKCAWHAQHTATWSESANCIDIQRMMDGINLSICEAQLANGWLHACVILDPSVKFKRSHERIQCTTHCYFICNGQMHSSIMHDDWCEYQRLRCGVGDCLFVTRWSTCDVQPRQLPLSFLLHNHSSRNPSTPPPARWKLMIRIITLIDIKQADVWCGEHARHPTMPVEHTHTTSSAVSNVTNLIRYRVSLLQNVGDWCSLCRKCVSHLPCSTIFASFT